jgi:hypothetical protein
VASAGGSGEHSTGPELVWGLGLTWDGMLTCLTSSRTASRHWEWPSCRIFSFDLARCRGVRPARSRASTRAPMRTGRGKHAGVRGREERWKEKGAHTSS